MGQPVVPFCRVCLLPCLVVFAAVHHEIVAAMRVDPQIRVLLCRAPPECLGSRALRDASRDGIAAVEGEVRLEPRRTAVRRVPPERRVRGDDDVASRYPATVGLFAEWPFGQLIDRAVLEQQPAEPDDRTSETRQILPRMKLGLM